MDYFDFEFSGQIERFNVGQTRVVAHKVLILPKNIARQLPFAKFPRLRVEGEIAEIPIRNAWIPTGDGRWYVIVSPEVLHDADVDVGSTVEMRFKIDDQDWVDVPAALEERLGKDHLATEIWAGLSAGKKRGYAHHVATAKTDTTQQKRVAEALGAIKAGQNLRDYLAARRQKQ